MNVRRMPMSNLNDIFFTPAANQELTYDQVLEDVQRYFAENHASTIAEAGEGNAERATSLLKELMEHYIVKRKYALDGLSTKELCSKLYEDMAGYSFLKKWIYKPGVEEVNINAYNDIEVIESSGRSIKIPDKFSSPQHAIDVIRRMLNACGMVIDDTMPSIVGFLDKNIRISVDKTPIVDADVGVNASIRIVNQQTVSEEKLLNSGSATAEMLHFLTACIRYGVSVCIAGSTGSGKSTILSLICRNYEFQKGEILIDGIDIRKIKISSLRRHFGQMLQDVFLFSGTIRSNIVLREDNISDEEIMQVCRYVNADHFINKLDHGLDEEVRERGNNFSAGQRQLLSFARTIIHKPSVMILDEATANIDTETELLIQDSLEKMRTVGTMLIVAHRLSTIQHADNIIVLSHGKILEQGSHQELLARHGRYYQLYTLQYHKEQLSS